jgi:hypothetical protein
MAPSPANRRRRFWRKGCAPITAIPRTASPPCCQALRRPRPAPSAPSGPEESLALTAWTGPFPEVVIRPLACYEALISQEVEHD